MSPPQALLLRHAERGPLPAGLPGDHVPLTPAGRAAATALGASLGPPLTRVLASPVPRCVETATCLTAGAGRVIEVELHPLLGAPGPFVTDPALAWRAWLELGEAEMTQRLLADRVHRPGFRDRAAGAALLAGLIEEVLRSCAAGEVVALVTHDVVLGPTAAAWHPAAPAHPPAFLEAMCFARAAHGTISTWRGSDAPLS